MNSERRSKPKQRGGLLSLCFHGAPALASSLNCQNKPPCVQSRKFRFKSSNMFVGEVYKTFTLLPSFMGFSNEECCMCGLCVGERQWACRTDLRPRHMSIRFFWVSEIFSAIFFAIFRTILPATLPAIFSKLFAADLRHTLRVEKGEYRLSCTAASAASSAL